uniref:Uncharacterized protein n=1 Tax=Arundo donax TaxID=35708 RepID=A0A0A9SNM7_ARUDO
MAGAAGDAAREARSVGGRRFRMVFSGGGAAFATASFALLSRRERPPRRSRRDRRRTART